MLIILLLGVNCGWFFLPADASMGVMAGHSGLQDALVSWGQACWPARASRTPSWLYVRYIWTILHLTLILSPAHETDIRSAAKYQ